MNVSEAREIYLDELPRIERIVRHALRWSGLHGIDPEDFASVVKLKLIEDDYGVIRKFRGGSSFGTYLTSVIQRMLLDQRVREWGRWRPSTRARRLGAIAIRLEALTHRDGHTFDEACTILTRSEPAVSLADLEAMHAGLPRRRRRPVMTGSLREHDPATDGTEVEHAVHQRDRERLASRISRTLEGAVADLSPEDRTILELCYAEGFSAAAAARSLGVPRNRLCRQLARTLRQLREQLEADGVEQGAAQELLEHGASALELPFEASSSG